MCTIHGIHYIPSWFLSSQHGNRAVSSFVTWLVTNPFNNCIKIY